MYGLWSCFHTLTCSVTLHLVVHHELNTRERSNHQELGQLYKTYYEPRPSPKKTQIPEFV